MDDQRFRQLLNRLGLSWSGYRKVRKSAKKRIRRYMQRSGYDNLEDLFLALEKDRSLRLQIERLMTVSIRRFFRDWHLWHILENNIMGMAIENFREGIKVWSAGCACGEEVYSFKILWDRLKTLYRPVPKIELLATDMNPVYLKRAKASIYPKSSLREVSQEIREIYFEPLKEGRFYIVPSFLKDGILWKLHNLLSDPPGNDFHIIFLRNNHLTYYEIELKVPPFMNVVNSLAPGGFLIIGAHEKLPLEIPGLRPWIHDRCIFQKVKILNRGRLYEV